MIMVGINDCRGLFQLKLFSDLKCLLDSFQLNCDKDYLVISEKVTLLEKQAITQ